MSERRILRDWSLEEEAAMVEALKDQEGPYEYTITIERKKRVIKVGASSYEKIGGENEYGYVARPPYLTKESETVYKQTVESINVIEVVAAINGAKFE